MLRSKVMGLLQEMWLRMWAPEPECLSSNASSDSYGLGKSRKQKDELTELPFAISLFKHQTFPEHVCHCAGCRERPDTEPVP